MAIALESEVKPGLPVVKRTAIGQTFNGAIVKVEQRDRQKKNEQTGAMEPILKGNGKPRQELVLTLLTLPRTDAPVGLADDEHQATEGELVRFILKGKTYSDWIEAKNSLGRVVNVGDVFTHTTTVAQVYDANGTPVGKELTTQEEVDAIPRTKTVGIYGPITLRAPKENSPWIAKAEEAYYSLKEPIAAESNSVGGDPGPQEPPEDDEPPF
jgi:hypothetical protein